MFKCKVDINAYIDYITDNLPFVESVENYVSEHFTNKYVNDYDIFNNARHELYTTWSWSSAKDRFFTFREEHINKLKLTNQYIESMDFYWDVVKDFDEFCVIRFGNVTTLILRRFITDAKYVKDIKDFDQVRMSELKEGIAENALISVSNDNLSLKNINDQNKVIEGEISSLKEELKSVENCSNSELAEMKAKIDEMMQEMRKKQNELTEELNKKLDEFNKKKTELEQKIYMLKTEIYSIQCYLGDVIEVVKIKDGETSNIETPLVVNQKIIYLDEDLARVMNIFDANRGNEYTILEEVLKYREDVLNLFCPQERCVSFFKCSKTGKSYQYDKSSDILMSFDTLHGNKMGFILRDNENLFVGYMEDEWDKEAERKITFNDSLIYKPGTSEVAENSEEPNNTPVNEKVSRIFAINILQGLIDNKKIIRFPEEVKIVSPSKYIVHNYAEGWLDDNRYGDFAITMKNLRTLNHVGDTILLIQTTSESDSKTWGGNRSIGAKNTTRDCNVTSGMYNITTINEYGEVFIKVSRDKWSWNDPVNKASYMINDNEYINLTFVNSIWMKYYINTKKIGKMGAARSSRTGFHHNLDYAYLIKYFKQALEFIEEREAKAKAFILEAADDKIKTLIEENDEQWRVQLSYWCIDNNVHNINGFQMKRFVKFLAKGKYYTMNNFFADMKEDYYIKPQYFLHDFAFIDIPNFYSTTHYLPRDYCKDFEYGWNKDVNKILGIKLNNKTSAEDIDKLYKYQVEKLKLIAKSYLDWMSLMTDDVANVISFMKSNNLNKSIKEDPLYKKHYFMYDEKPVENGLFTTLDDWLSIINDITNYKHYYAGCYFRIVSVDERELNDGDKLKVANILYLEWIHNVYYDVFDKAHTKYLKHKYLTKKSYKENLEQVL